MKLLHTFIALLMSASLAFAQSMPSPTYNNMTVNGASTQKGKVKVGNGGWLEPIVPYTESINRFQSMSDDGVYGIIGASRSLFNYVPGAMSNIGVGAYGINNNTTQVQHGYGMYAEGRRYPGAGSTGGIESATVNRGSNVTVSPYLPVAEGQNGSYWASCGRPDVTDSQTCSYAYGLLNAGPAQNSPFNTGILFTDKSLSLSGGQATAIDFPKSYNLIWRNPANGNVSAAIRSNIDTTSPTAAISFENNGIQFENNIGTMVARFSNTAATITPSIFSNAINSTNISATGTISATSSISAGTGFRSAGSATPSLFGSSGTGAAIVCTAGHVCDQFSGQYQLTTGTGTSIGSLFRVTFGTARASAPNCTVSGRSNDFGQFLQIINNTSTTTLDVIQTTSALLASTVYQISYVCGGV